MQYKIPVQIENEDPIIFWLSLRQVIIVVVWVWLAYATFDSLEKNFSTEVALIPAIVIAAFFLLIAVFKYSEMTFVHFILAFIRYKVNISERKWTKWIDSFSPLEVWYIVWDTKINKKVDFWDKLDKIKTIDEQLDKI